MQKAIVFCVGLVAGVAIAIGLAASGWLDQWTGVHKPPTGQFGSFSSQPVTRWLDDGRTMVLEEDFVYIDPAGKVWLAAKNEVVDGASIPQAIWSITGPPFGGQFRNASIVHDAGCNRRSESSDEVHRMFYDACRCGGVPEVKAKALYAAVYWFGPQWEMRSVPEVRMIRRDDGTMEEQTVHRTVSHPLEVPDADPEVARRLLEFVESQNPSLSEITDIGLDRFQQDDDDE